MVTSVLDIKILVIGYIQIKDEWNENTTNDINIDFFL